MGTISTHACDVTDVNSVEGAIKYIAKSCGGVIDMLWNNAGYQGKIQPTLEYDPADFENVMNVNITGMFFVLQSVAKRMWKAAAKGDGGGGSSHPVSIVNMASVAALRGTPAMVAYASSKAAILFMTFSLAKVRDVLNVTKCYAM